MWKVTDTAGKEGGLLSHDRTFVVEGINALNKCLESTQIADAAAATTMSFPLLFVTRPPSCWRDAKTSFTVKGDPGGGGGYPTFSQTCHFPPWL